jgi:hypothetical protein
MKECKGHRAHVFMQDKMNRPYTEQGRKNWDNIFSKEKKEDEKVSK